MILVWVFGASDYDMFEERIILHAWFTLGAFAPVLALSATYVSHHNKKVNSRKGESLATWFAALIVGLLAGSVYSDLYFSALAQKTPVQVSSSLQHE